MTTQDDDEAGRTDTGGQPGESEKERVDRELIEFLNEVRVVLPGVQVLFAFLLTLPFTGKFGSLDSGQKIAYSDRLLRDRARGRAHDQPDRRCTGCGSVRATRSTSCGRRTA